MATEVERAIKVLSSEDFPVYKLVSHTEEEVETEIYIPHFGCVTFFSSSREIKVKTAADANAERLVKVGNVLAPFGSITEIGTEL